MTNINGVQGNVFSGAGSVTKDQVVQFDTGPFDEFTISRSGATFQISHYDPENKRQIRKDVEQAQRHGIETRRIGPNVSVKGPVEAVYASTRELRPMSNRSRR